MASRKTKPRRPTGGDNGPAGVEPGVRTFTTWTPTLLRAAERNADAGSLRLAASLVDWLLADDRVQGTLQGRIQALLGLEPSFESAGDKRRSKSVVNALDAKEDWWASYPESDLALMMSWGIMLGIAPMRHRWGTAPGHGDRVLPMPEFWHPQHLRQDQFTREWKIWVQATVGTAGVVEQTLTPGDGEWILHTPYGTHRPQMLGLWRGLSRWVLLKHLALGDLANASAKGSTLAATNEKQAAQKDELGRSAEAQRLKLATDIQTRGRDGVIVLPPGYDLKLIQTAANTESIYKAQVELANEAIAIAVRGGNLTTQVKGGSLAATESQERLGDGVRLEFDGMSVTTTLHDQSLVPWAEFNFGDGSLAPWPCYPTKPKGNTEAKAAAIAKATDAAEGLMSLGLKIEQQAFIDEWGLSSWVKPNGELLAVPPPNPLGPPPGPTPPPAPTAGTPPAPGAKP